MARPHPRTRRAAIARRRGTAYAACTTTVASTHIRRWRERRDARHTARPDPVRPLGGHDPRGGRAPVVSDQVEGAGAERVGDRPHPLLVPGIRVVLHAVGNIRVALPEQVRRDHPVPGFEQGRDLAAVHRRGVWDARHQHDRDRAGPALNTLTLWPSTLTARRFMPFRRRPCPSVVTGSPRLPQTYRPPQTGPHWLSRSPPGPSAADHQLTTARSNASTAVEALLLHRPLMCKGRPHQWRSAAPAGLARRASRPRPRHCSPL
jgi:hypothetical protein